MLKFNLRRLFKQWGIAQPALFLLQNGFSKAESYRLLHDNIKVVHIRQLQKLCLALHCTPDDLMEWVPEKPEDSRVCLAKLIRKGSVDLRNISLGFPHEKLEELAQKIVEAKKELLEKK